MRLTPIVFRSGITVVRESASSHVRSRAGYDAGQWIKFLAITAQVGKTVASNHPTPSSLRWGMIPAAEQKTLIQEVHDLLEQRNMHKPPHEVTIWRMSRVLETVHRTTTAQNLRDEYEKQIETIAGRLAVKASVARFRGLVKRELHNYLDQDVDQDADHTWTEIPMRDKYAIRDQVNAQLKEEGILSPSDELMFLRMELCFTANKRRGNRKAKEQVTIEGE